MSFNERLQEAVGPDPDPSKCDEETLKMLKGFRCVGEVHFRLSETSTPELHNEFKDLMARYSWEEATITEVQTGLRLVFADQQELKEQWSAFLDAPTISEEEQTKAKELLGDLTGCHITMKRKPGLPSHREQRDFLEDVEKYFENQPEKYDEFAWTGIQIFSSEENFNNEDFREGLFAKQAKLLKDDPELVRMFYANVRGYENMPSVEVKFREDTESGTSNL